MSQALFFHAGCPVCVSAEQQFIQALDTTKYTVEVVHLGEQKDRIAQAERYGVKSVPALVIEGQAIPHQLWRCAGRSEIGGIPS
jgi:predicted DsbA family dithiol-disulfide isomerase